MHYDAIVTREGKRFTVTFPDCPGCNTFAETEDDVLPTAREALEGWLEANLAERLVPSRPSKHRAPANSTMLRVDINLILSTTLQLRWARQERGMSQGALAELVGVSQQAIAKIEGPDANPTLDTIQKIADALGQKATLSFDDVPGFVMAPAKKKTATKRR